MDINIVLLGKQSMIIASIVGFKAIECIELMMHVLETIRVFRVQKENNRSLNKSRSN